MKNKAEKSAEKIAEKLAFEKKFGRYCRRCGFRDKAIYASKSAEGGRTSICRCERPDYE